MQSFHFPTFLDRHGLDAKELNTVLAFLPPLSPAGPWLAGGALRRTISGQPLDSDFDFFFASKEQLEEFSKAIRNEPNIRVLKERQNQNNLQLLLELSEEMGVDKGIFQKNITVQCISIGFYNGIEAVLDSFDFTICQFGFDGQQLYCGDYALWDLARKRVVVNKITYPVASVRRLIKYTGQGFYACAGCLKQILETVVAEPRLIENSTLYID